MHSLGPFAPGASARALWTLDPTVDFLNHGSFGATPRSVLDAQAAWRARMEAQPVAFLARELEPEVQRVRARLAGFLRADPAGLALVPNATTGVNTVLRAFDWRAGDEVLICDHTYGAVKSACRMLAERHGVVPVEVRIPFPAASADEAVEAYARGITPRTRLVIVDHIASPTALVFDIARIVAHARAAGVPVLVDGAHGPGMRSIDLDALGADFYTGNLHKWVCAPKGAAFLWMAPAWRGRVHPLTVSHGYGGGLAAEFDWTGTADPSPWLCVPDALDACAAFPDMAAYNHSLVRQGRAVIADALGVALPHADDPALYGFMAAIPYPAARVTLPTTLRDLTAALFASHRIEVPFTSYDGRVFVRISGQVYNTPDQYARLADVLRTFEPPR
jgi:isopenicillin-N epimerase